MNQKYGEGRYDKNNNGPSEVNETLRQTLLMEPSVKLEINTLKTGDFLINDLLLVERKTFRDFVASIN